MFILLSILFYIIFNKSLEWKNGELVKIKIHQTSNCISHFDYKTKDNILTGTKLNIGNCENAMMFRKLGTKLGINSGKDNECLVYNKPNIMSWRQCDDENIICKSQTDIYDKNIAYMDCMNFEFIRNLDNTYKIKIKGKDNKCLHYLGNNNWGELYCTDPLLTYFDLLK